LWKLLPAGSDVVAMSSEPNYLVGFLLTCLAGVTTCLGVAFIPLVNSGILSEKNSLAASLGFAAGVMLWLSFMDLLGGAAKNLFTAHFNDHGHDHGDCYENEEPVGIRIWIMVFFFIGMAFTALMEHVVDRYFGHAHGHGHGHSEDAHEGHGHGQELTRANAQALNHGSTILGDGTVLAKANDAAKEADTLALMKISLVAMLGLALHNFPEGLAVFLTASDANFAIVLGIALHNIPGGAAIAVPIYKTTSSYTKAIGATLLTGAFQPFGALVGWGLIVGLGLGTPTDFVFGAIYAATAGTLVSISIAGLLPESFAKASNFFVLVAVSAGFLMMETSNILMEAFGDHGHEH